MHQHNKNPLKRRKFLLWKMLFPERIRSYDEAERPSPATAGAGNAPRRNNIFRAKLPLLASYSIPLGCIIALFFGFIYGTYFIDSGLGENQVYAEDTIMPTALSYTALTIGGDALDKQVTVAPGSVGYRNHTITIATSQLSNYTLTISGPVGLSSTGGSIITGAGGKTPTGTNSMPNNSWGYAYGQTGASESMTYSSFTGTNQTLDTITSGNVNTGISTNDTTKNLSFAIKFADNAISTNYTGKVVLSLIATPKS